MNLNTIIPTFLGQSNEQERHIVTRKRMERFTSNGHLLSVTDVKTTHFNESPPARILPPSNYYSTSRYSNNRNTIRDSDYDYQTIRTNRSHPDSLRNIQEDRRFNGIEKEYPIKRVDRVVPHEIIREYQREYPATNEWKTTNSYVGKTSVLKPTSKKDPQYPRRPILNSHVPQRVEWREPLDCLIERINKIRLSMACQPLQPSVRLADIAAQWARTLVLRGEFRSDPNRFMNIWIGNRVNDCIADVWWDEAEEYGTKNHLDDNDLSWVGVASAYSDQHRQFIVVAVYE